MITEFDVYENDASTARSIMREKVRDYFQGMPDAITSTNNPALFNRFTNLTQSTLEGYWKSGKNLTSCNAMVGRYAAEILKGKKNVEYFNAFNIKFTCKMMGVPEAWTPKSADPSVKPGFGDVVRWNKFHVGVSLGFANGNWNTVEGGAGQVSAGFCAVKKKARFYDPSEIMGWANMALLFEKLKAG